MMGKHSLTEKIPTHLFPFIAEQDYSLYTPLDQACWRFILRLSQPYFARYAHQKYLDGLRETGISTERIPRISDMDLCLKKFGWRAVPVSGFVPSPIFMEFLSLGILPIACEMRTLEHIAYTPAPDIVHEAAGHAPIITDPEYASYLRSYGEISRKAITSSEDEAVYQAIRLLSDRKENPASTEVDIQNAQGQLDRAVAGVTFVSEGSLLSRMGWWTFEYGLVGSKKNPKIYGAGLLSSIGESYHFLGDQVEKIDFSIACIEKSFDITRPQPQLYVAPHFQALTQTLEELSKKMAYTHGGQLGLDKAIRAKTVTTTVLDSGVQISGVLTNSIPDSSGTPCYLQFTGPTQLAYHDEEIPGHGINYHQHGFGTPLEEISERNLDAWNLKEGSNSEIQLSSGVIIRGRFIRKLSIRGELVILSFEHCIVQFGNQVLFQPEWGTYDMTCGKNIVSVFGGPADRSRYGVNVEGFHPQSQTHKQTQKVNPTANQGPLGDYYQEVRDLRESGAWNEGVVAQLTSIYQKLTHQFPHDWLLRFELLELGKAHIQENKIKVPWLDQLKGELLQIATETSTERAEVIRRGLALLETN